MKHLLAHKAWTSHRVDVRSLSNATTGKEAEVLKQLSNIIDPDLGQDIVSLGFIKELKIAGGSVTFNLELTTPGEFSTTERDFRVVTFALGEQILAPTLALSSKVPVFES